LGGAGFAQRLVQVAKAVEGVDHRQLPVQHQQAAKVGLRRHR